MWEGYITEYHHKSHLNFLYFRLDIPGRGFTFLFHTGPFLTLSNNVDDKLQTEHILITDVSQRNEDSLICWYHTNQFSPSQFSWYHKHFPSDRRTQIPKTMSYYFGWSSKPDTSNRYQMLKLLRQPDTVAVEGVLTCYFRDKGSTSVGIHYPSEFHVFE